MGLDIKIQKHKNRRFCAFNFKNRLQKNKYACFCAFEGQHRISMFAEFSLKI
jgi:hypothetical protein